MTMKAILIAPYNFTKMRSSLPESRLSTADLQAMVEEYKTTKIQSPVYFVPLFESDNTSEIWSWGTVPEKALKENFRYDAKHIKRNLTTIVHK